MKVVDSGLVKFTIDPNEGYKGIKDSKLMEATGMLPYFAAEAALCTPTSVKEAFDILMECYGYGMGQDGSGWGTVSDKGTYQSEYDEDPDIEPMVKFELTEDIDFLVYQYAICAVTDGETTLMMRMD
jgi:hypothetical protein